MFVQYPVRGILSDYILDAALFGSDDVHDEMRTVIPDGRTTLLMSLGDGGGKIGGNDFPLRKYGVVVMGNHTRAFTYTLFAPARFFYIRFHPYGFNLLMGINGRELLNRLTDLSVITGTSGRNLESLLAAEKSDGDAINRLMRWLEQKALTASAPGELILSACQSIKQNNGKVSVMDLCGGSYNTYKQLQRRFDTATGLNAKLYARMVRFEAIVEQMRTDPVVDWFDMVARYDLHDQSHLIKEFKFFSEHTPTGFIEKGIERFV